jgi:hypothetical protein
LRTAIACSGKITFEVGHSDGVFKGIALAIIITVPIEIIQSPVTAAATTVA